MSAPGAEAVAFVALSAPMLAVGVPWVFMRALSGPLSASERAVVTNFRGRPVHSGLGIVWLVWAGVAMLGGVGAGRILGSVSVAPLLAVAGLLALVAFALGLIDDAYGSSAQRGFSGHVRALIRGRLTTGGLKLVGIGSASLLVAFVLAEVAPWGVATVPAVRVVLALIAGAAVALTSNLVNLTDLRPGRALKVYALLACAGVVSAGVLLPGSPLAGGEPNAGSRSLDTFILACFMAGPLVAVWRDDLHERGMLGDAGANPMGAVAGLLIVSGLPAFGLVAYAALVLALNLVSERVSFSVLIERTPVLAFLDGLGRRSEDGREEGCHQSASRE